MAIIKEAGPSDENQNAGQFALPANFDKNRFASKFVKIGNEVRAAEARQSLVGTGYTADGWAVWKNDAGEYHSVTVADGTYVLMFRPIDIQQGVDKVFGDLSRKRMLSEKRGETIDGKPVKDTGMLTEDRLTRILGSEGVDDGQSSVFSGIPTARNLTAEDKPLSK